MKNIFILTVLGILLIVLASIVPIPGADVWYGQYLMLFGLMFLGISLVLWKFNKWLSVFTILCLISAILVTKLNMKAVLCLLQVDLACLATYAISRFDKVQRRWLLRTIFAIAMIQGIWVIVQSLNMDPIFYKIGDRLLDDTVGFSGSKNQLGAFLAITAPVVLEVCPWLLPLSIFGIFKSVTSTAWLALCVGTMFYCWAKVRKLFCALTVTMMVSTFVFILVFDKNPQTSLEQRGHVFGNTIKAVATGKIAISKEVEPGKSITKTYICNPMFGYGLGAFSRIFPYSNHDFVPGAHVYGHCHNDFLEGFFDLGFLGFYSLIFLVIGFLIDVYRNRAIKEAMIYGSSLIAYLVCANGIFPSHTAVNGMLLIVFYGMFRGSLRENKNE